MFRVSLTRAGKANRVLFGVRVLVCVFFGAEDGDLLSMVPPTIEALMDIMEGSRDLTELLDNEAAPDVVDQTRGLVEQVIKQVCGAYGKYFFQHTVTNVVHNSTRQCHGNVGCRLRFTGIFRCDWSLVGIHNECFSPAKFGLKNTMDRQPQRASL